MIKNKSNFIKVFSTCAALTMALTVAAPTTSLAYYDDYDDYWNEGQGDVIEDWVNGYVSIHGGNHVMTEGDQIDIGLTCKITSPYFHDQYIEWYSYSPEVASVSGGRSGATITANSAGHASIKAKLYIDGDFFDEDQIEIDVNAKYVPLNGIGVTPASCSLDINQYKMATVTYNPTNATNKSVSWFSDNPIVASVSSEGKIVGVSQGVTTVHCRSNEGNYEAPVLVSVSRNVASAGSPVATPAVLIDNNLMYEATTAILNAAPNQIVTVAYNRPMAYDINVINAIASRPDIQLITNYHYLGKVYTLSIPKGYNMTKLMNAAGYVDWLTLGDQIETTVKELK